jgi:hypothetical protein
MQQRKEEMHINLLENEYVSGWLENELHLFA